jgi:PAS domain S-box-containing protein
MNTSAEDITGMSEKEVLDRELQDIFSSLKKEDSIEDLKLKIPQDLVLRDKDGSEVAVNGALTAIEGFDGKTEGYVAIFRVKNS